MRGAVFSVSLVMQVAIMSAVLVAIWYTFTPYMDSTKAMDATAKLRAIAEHVEEKAFYELRFLDGNPNAEIREKLYLPQLEFYYVTNISCASGRLVINASAPAIERNFIIQENFICSGIEAGGEVVAGERCLIGNSSGIYLVDYCG